MKFLRASATGIILCIVELITGILLLLNPAKFASTVIVGTGVVLIALGLIEIVRYFRTDPQRGLSRSDARQRSCRTSGRSLLPRAMGVAPYYISRINCGIWKYYLMGRGQQASIYNRHDSLEIPPTDLGGGQCGTPSSVCRRHSQQPLCLRRSLVDLYWCCTGDGGHL